MQIKTTSEIKMSAAEEQQAQTETNIIKKRKRRHSLFKQLKNQI